ncbi:MAG: T9SS type A sorting domain-containing protein [Bacteroidetes bacterium]|nr:T9SS type A sorting domain-containing protein [Bacteroidota bacterium]
MNKLIQQAWMLVLGYLCLASGVHASTLLSAAKCVTETYTEQHICPGDSFLFNQKWIKDQGTYDAVFTSSEGCDSFVHFTLWIMPTSLTEIEMDLCQGEKITIEGYKIDHGGDFTFHLRASWGCDSTVLVHVIEKQAPVVTVNKTLCEGDSLQFGRIWIKESGSYQLKFARSGSCDSIVNLQVSKIQTRAPIEREYDGLLATIVVEDYQWLACPSYIAIPNANKQKLTVAGAGNYSLRVENKGCIDTMKCIHFDRNTSGLEDENKVEIKIYPNPATDVLKIDGEFTSSVEVELYSMLGQIVQKKNFEPNASIRLDLADLPKGRYILRILSSGIAFKQELIEIR